MKTVFYFFATLLITVIAVTSVFAGTDQTGKQRLIGYRINEIMSDGTMLFTDSGNYTYSAYRGDTGVYNEKYDLFNIIGERNDSLLVDYKHIITRDANGNMLEHLEKTWNGVQLKDRYRRVYTYDGNGNVTKDLRQTFFQNAWRDDGAIEYEYDPQSSEISRTDYARLLGVWQITGKKHTYYNVAGDISLEIILEDSAGVWDTASITTFTYNATHQLLVKHNTGFVNDSILSELLQTNTYNSNGKLLTYHQQILYNTVITNQRKFYYTYNSSNKMISELYMEGAPVLDSMYYSEWVFGVNDSVSSYAVYNWNTGARAPYFRRLYTYNTNNLLSEITYQGWDSIAWATGGRYTFTYDANNYLDLFTHQHLNMGNWESYKQEDYNCNTHGNVEYILKREWKNATWENQYEEFRYYEDYDDATALPALPATFAFSLYPNPTGNNLSIDFNSPDNSAAAINVYNGAGQKVMSIMANMSAGNNQVLLNVSGLASGLYTVVLTGVLGVGNSQFVKQ